MKKIVTHNDRFHADDVFAVATLDLVFNGEIDVVRTRDSVLIDSADIALDVGNIYDPDSHRYDHHQKDGAGKRENAIPYASFGLIWKHFGRQLCSDEMVQEIVEQKIVQQIDAGDNGYSIYDLRDDSVGVYNLGDLIGSFNPTWKETDDLYDKNFFIVVEIAKKIIEREIKRASDKVEAIPKVLKIYEETENKRIIVLDENYPWRDILKDKGDIFFVISPSKIGDSWRINTIQSDQFINKKDLPKEWAGLKDEELQNISGVKDAKFCHRNLFLAVTASKEGAIKMAKIALER